MKTKPKPAPTLGQRIEAARKAAGLTRRALALLVDTSEMYLYQLERDKRGPSLAILRRIAQALGVSPGALTD